MTIQTNKHFCTTSSFQGNPKGPAVIYSIIKKRFTWDIQSKLPVGDIGFTFKHLIHLEVTPFMIGRGDKI